MTITRREQIAAETGSNYEWPIDNGAGSAETTTDLEFTGNRSASYNTSFALGVFTSYAKFRAGFFFAFSGINSAGDDDGNYRYIVHFEDGFGNVYGLADHYFSGEIGWYDETAAIFTPEQDTHKFGMATAGIFRHIGVFCDNDNSVSFYVDGRLLFTKTGIANFTRMMIGGGAGGGAYLSWYADDFYLDELTDEVDHCPPTVRFVPSFPSALGDDTDWFTGRTGIQWQQIEEVPVDRGDYLYTDAADQKITSEGTDIVFNETLYDFDAVVVNGILIAEAGLPEIRFIIRDSTPVYANGADQIVDTDYALYQERFTAQPDTTAWNITDFNAMQVGIESRGDYLL